MLTEYRTKYRLFLSILLITLAACGSSRPEEAADAPPAQTPPAATPAPAVDTVAYGRNENGTFFYGAPDAPVTLTDYSDFL
jgi:hypothetical protein